jgi:Phage integrase, N-terminal SAM-like domain
MNALVVADRTSEWRRLKALMLDSVSSPITRRVYNLGLDEFIAWFAEEPRPAGITKATVTAWRVALEARGLGPISINVRITAVRKLAVEAADSPGTGVGHRADQGRQIARRPRRELAFAPPGGGAPERAGRAHEEGTARPCRVRHAARVRIAPVRIG